LVDIGNSIVDFFFFDKPLLGIISEQNLVTIRPVNFFLLV
jgi:hypothetical protein